MLLVAGLITIVIKIIINKIPFVKNIDKRWNIVATLVLFILTIFISPSSEGTSAIPTLERLSSIIFVTPALFGIGYLIDRFIVKNKTINLNQIWLASLFLVILTLFSNT